MSSLRLLSSPKHALIGLLITGALLGILLSASLPGISFLGIGILAFPLLVLLVAALGGILPTLLSIALIALAAHAVYGSQGLWFLVYLLPLALAFLACLEIRLPFFRSAAVLFMTFVISIVVLYAILQRQAGGSMFQVVTKAAIDSLDGMASRDSILYALWKSGFLSHGLGDNAQVFISRANGSWTFKPEVISEFNKQLSFRLEGLMAAFLPGLLSSYAITVSLPGAAFALKVANRYQTASRLGMPPFSLWYIPKSAGKLMLVLALGYLLASVTQSLLLRVAGQLMYNVFFSLYAIQGLANVNFNLKKRGTKPIVRFLLLLLLYAILPPAALIIGIYDQAVDPRKLRTQPSGM